ncbi:speedy protein 1-A [Lingula anatina]|uniref:Speedy protein 1-A n=1 Tax=Lingula anatina TaxID=7574 RepID=A0A1S3IQX7_LINAN|nr:speedy protein 1-A [Lingula anatina]|eukprot:XP_013400468.1 speedy protein 1-A [Lingula anatina]
MMGLMDFKSNGKAGQREVELEGETRIELHEYISNDNLISSKSSSQTQNKRARPKSPKDHDLVSEKENVLSPAKKPKRPILIVKSKEIQSFFQLLEDEVITEFLARDRCLRISDKYLLAMVFAFFKRAGLATKEYSRMNFFIALYLANDMEEDDEDWKYEIFPWALGKTWKNKYPNFLKNRDKLWKKMEYRAVVSKQTCEEIMSKYEPDHYIWTRDRPEYHAGAIRTHNRDEDEAYPRGPDGSPHFCLRCDSCEYASEFLEEDSWYLSSCTESSPESVGRPFHLVPGTGFDLEDLKLTLQDDESSFWACFRLEEE